MLIRTFFFFLGFLLSLHAKESICLTMVVQNNEKTIEKCLSSIKPFIDYWVIIDTGSVDDTISKIRSLLHDLPGELHEQAWVDFLSHRNESLRLARNKGTYLLILDPTEYLEFQQDFIFPSLEQDLYYAQNIDEIKQVILVKNDLNFEWKGLFQPIFFCPQAETSSLLSGVLSVSIESALEKQFWEHPTNPHYAFYHGVIHLVAKNYSLASKYFQKRIQIRSEDAQETLCAMENLHFLQQQNLKNQDTLDLYLKRYSSSPAKAEPLFHMATIYRDLGNLPMGYLVSKFAISLPKPLCHSIAEEQLYEQSLPIEYANCVLLLGMWEEGVKACEKLLAIPSLSSGIRAQILNNYELAKKNSRR